MKTHWMLPALLAMGLAPTLGLADDEAVKPPPDQPKQETPPKPEPPAQENRGAQKQVDKLTAEFGVSAKEVAGLRAKGLGWGEVRHALAIARKSGQPVSEVMKLRDSGMGWGEIAQHYGFKLGDVSRHAMKDKDGDRDARRDAVGARRGGERGAGNRGDRGSGRGGPPAWSRGGGRH